MARFLKRSAWTFPLAAVVALIIFGFNEYSNYRASSHLTLLSQRAQVRLKLQQLLIYMADSETGQRGFLLTGRDEYLGPLKLADDRIEKNLSEISPYFVGHPTAGAIFHELSILCSQKQVELKNAIELYRVSKHDAWRHLLMTDIGKLQMDSIRANVSLLLDIEVQELDKQRSILYQSFTISRLTISSLTALGLVCLMLFLRKTKILEQTQLNYAADLAMERDKLEKQVVLRTVELTHLAKYLQTIREEEKSSLARELHDELGSLLTAAKLDMARLKRSLGEMSPELVQRMEHLGQTINAGIGLKRRIIEDLRPSSLSNLGLLAALEIHLNDFQERSGLTVLPNLQTVTLPDGADIVIYRFVQEALTNIIKHAQATQVEVTLRPDGDKVYMAVHDNGVGMPVRGGKAIGGVHGLLGMRYRIESVCGRMSIHSVLGQGTCLEAWIPTVSLAVVPHPEPVQALQQLGGQGGVA